MPSRVLIRRDTSSNWSSVNPVLADGEIGYDTTLDRIKVGDGASGWNALPFTTNVSLATNADNGLMSAANHALLTASTDANTVSTIVKRDANGDFSARLITSSGTPSTATHLVNKGYVDAIASGLDVRQSVRAATTENSDLSGVVVIDGITLISGDRVLVKDQTDQAQNGIYTVASGSWSRSSDCNENAEVTSGLFIYVSEGTANADSGWVLTTNDPITVGSTNLQFTQFSGAGQIIAGTAMSKSGNTLNVSLTDSISSTSTTTAATPSSVKSAYDLAATKTKSIRQASAPASPANGDIWVDSDAADVAYIYDSSTSSWASVKADAPVVPDATSSVKGIVMLESATNSASTTKAATPYAVKAAYDLATTTITIAGNADTTAASALSTASSKISESIVTAKGDIIAATASGAVDNLAVGANNTMLLADSAQPMGVKWASAIYPSSSTISGNLSVGGDSSFTGSATFTGAVQLQEIAEDVADVTLVSNVATLDWTSGNIYYIATAPTDAMTFNVTNLPTTGSKMYGIVVLVVQGSTGRIPSVFQIGGAAQTIKWPGGTAPTPTSSAGKIDIFSFNMQRTSGGQWIVYGSSALNF